IVTIIAWPNDAAIHGRGVIHLAFMDGDRVICAVPAPSPEDEGNSGRIAAPLFNQYVWLAVSRNRQTHLGKAPAFEKIFHHGVTLGKGAAIVKDVGHVVSGDA